MLCWISEEERLEEEAEEEAEMQPTAKVGAKKQKKQEEKQAKKAQREVSASYHTLICVRRYHEDYMPVRPVHILICDYQV